MRRRAVAGLAVAVTLAAQGVGPASFSAPAAAASKPGAPFVAGTTVLKGDRATAMNVRVPQDGVLDLTPTERADGSLWPKALRVSGGSGYVGFLLTERATTRGFYAVAARLPRALTDGSSTHRAVGHGQPAVADRESFPAPPSPLSDPPPPSCTRCRVPAGDYRLQLITFGAPATVRLTFEGLSGETTLRPSAPRLLLGMSSSFMPRNTPTHVVDGGGMGMGLGWSWREPGVMLSTYQLAVSPRQTPVAITNASACRGLNDRETCDGQRGSAGTAPSMAGWAALSGNRVDSASTSLSFSMLGDTDWIARTTMLWIPTGRADTVFEVVLEAEGDPGVEAFDTRVFR